MRWLLYSRAVGRKAERKNLLRLAGARSRARGWVPALLLCPGRERERERQRETEIWGACFPHSGFRMGTFYRNARIPVPPFDSCSSSLLGLFRGCSLGCVCFELMAKLALVVYAISPIAFRTCRGRRRRAGRGVSPLSITLPKEREREREREKGRERE